MKIKALILNKYIRVNVRHRAFKCWLAQTSGFILLATVAILNQTTQKNHPVCLRFLITWISLHASFFINQLFSLGSLLLFIIFAFFSSFCSFFPFTSCFQFPFFSFSLSFFALLSPISVSSSPFRRTVRNFVFSW